MCVCDERCLDYACVLIMFGFMFVCCLLCCWWLFDLEIMIVDFMCDIVGENDENVWWCVVNEVFLSELCDEWLKWFCVDVVVLCDDGSVEWLDDCVCSDCVWGLM